jgi:alkylation response protein AidB-like acyl-CoA dehydrogenase
MDLQLTDEQTWLSESVETMLSRRAAEDGIVDPGAGDDLWRELAEFGALEIGVDDEESLGAVEAALIARALGRHLAAVPYVDSAATRYGLDRIGAGPELATDGRSAAACMTEPGRRFAPRQPSCELSGQDLHGSKSAVPHAGTVDFYVAPAVRDGDPVAAIVASDAPGVEYSAEPSLDRSIAQSLVRFDAVEAAPERVIGEAEAGEFIDAVAAAGAVLSAAEATGAAAAVLELARDYASQRRQFGRAIASFQALRHILADMYVKVESSWSAVLYAAASLDEAEPGASTNSSIAKAYASRATLDVAHSALQVFGGIAFTDEHSAHRFLRRVIVCGRHFGSAQDHERLLGAALAR